MDTKEIFIHELCFGILVINNNPRKYEVSSLLTIEAEVVGNMQVNFLIERVSYSIHC